MRIIIVGEELEPYFSDAEDLFGGKILLFFWRYYQRILRHTDRASIYLSIYLFREVYVTFWPDSGALNVLTVSSAN